MLGFTEYKERLMFGVTEEIEYRVMSCTGWGGNDSVMTNDDQMLNCEYIGFFKSSERLH